MPYRRSAATDIALIAAFAALIAVLGLPGGIPVAGSGVPILLQNLGIMLAGAVLGARRGTLSVLLFQALTLAGLPLLAGGRGGLGILAGPTVGYFLSYPVVAAVIGLGTQALLPRYRVWAGILVNLLGGVVVCHAMGIAGMMLRAGMSLTKAWAIDVAFVPGDAGKAVLAAALAAAAFKAVPGLTPPLRNRALDEPDPFADPRTETGTTLPQDTDPR